MGGGPSLRPSDNGPGYAAALALARPRIRKPTAPKPRSISIQDAGSGTTVMLASELETTTSPFTTLDPNGTAVKSTTRASVVMPAVSATSGVFWFRVIFKPPELKTTSFAGGMPEKVIDVPRSPPESVSCGTLLMPAALGDPSPLTKESEVIVVTERLKTQDSGTD